MSNIESIYAAGVRFDGIIQPVSKPEISVLTNKAQTLKYQERNALNRIFGKQELDGLIKHGSNPNALNLFSPLLREIFDKRSTQDVKCTVPFNGKTVYIQEKATPIHTRSSFISTILEEKDHIENGALSIARIDLERFRDADFDVRNNQGIRPADVIINTTARIIREALKETFGKDALNTENSYEVGRYGGDELVIAFIGTQANNNKTKAMNLVIEKLQATFGYYKNPRNREIEKIPIRLKQNKSILEGDNRIEWIHFPQIEPEEAKDLSRLKDKENRVLMFREYLERGLILNDGEFAREIAKYTQGGVFNFEAYRSDYPKGSNEIHYPDSIYLLEEKGINLLEEKIDFIVDMHPELKTYFNLARIFDVQDGMNTRSADVKNFDSYITNQDIKNSDREELLNKMKNFSIADTAPTTRRKKLHRIVENKIFDRLLGDMIYSRPHFIDDISHGSINKIHVIDFKFLKEMNTATYADADNAIKLLWKKIQSSIPVDEMRNVIVSRFAGAIYVGVKEGAELSLECTKALQEITSLTIENEKNVTVPVGHSEIDLTQNENKGLPAHEILEKLDKSSDKIFYESLMSDILTEVDKGDAQYIDKIRDVSIDELSERSYKSLSKQEMFALYLRGTRMISRTLRFIENTEGAFGNNSHYSLLRDALEKESIKK